MAGLIAEFKEFAVKGNVMDLAVGVIIGAAFGKIVTSLVEDIVMPPLGAITGQGKDLAGKFISLNGQDYASYAEAKKAGAAVIGYGAFFSTILNFLVVAFAVFIVVKIINRARRRDGLTLADAAPPAPTRQEELLTEIRDSLQSRPVA